MTWIVKVALERPLTFIVMALLLLIFGPMAASKMAVDIFPDIGIPVIGVAFQYAGLSPKDMASRIIAPYERSLTTTVNDIEHTKVNRCMDGDRQDLFPAGRRYPHSERPGYGGFPDRYPADADGHPAALDPELQRLDGPHPATGDVEPDPVGTAGARSFAKFHPAAAHHRRGGSTSYPYGGKTREIQVDLDPHAMQADGLSATDVESALASQNQVNPVGLPRSDLTSTWSSSTIPPRLFPISTTCQSRRSTAPQFT